MKLSSFLALCLLVTMLIFCSHEEIPLSEETIKTEILAWWGAKIFEGVVIEDTVLVKKTYEVSARMVVCFDTLDQMKYVLKQFRKGWRVWKGPVDEKTKRAMMKDMLNIPLHTAKNTILMSNMREVQRAIMQFAMESDGRYPAHFNVKSQGSSYSVREILRTHLSNPYIQGAPAVMISRGDTSEWFGAYEGKVIYFPIDINFDELYSSRYVIKGSSDKRFLKHVVKSDNLYEGE